MGTSINCWAEVKKGDKWEIVNDEIFPEYMSKTEFSCACFSLRNYRVYAFLAGVRNDYGSHVLVMPREFPQDSEFLHEKMPWGRTRQEDLENDYDAHGKSYLMLRELLEFGYDDEYIYDPHYKHDDGSYGKKMPYREWLGGMFFRHLEVLKTLGNPDEVRIVFYFQ